MGAMEHKTNWWDKLGAPQYGGEMVIRLNRKIVNFDPYFGYHLTQIHTAWLEKMFVDDWTLPPETYDYRKNLRPNQWVKGHLAESWEFTNPFTLLFISAKEFIGRISRPLTDANLPPMILLFISIVCSDSAAVTVNPVPVRR